MEAIANEASRKQRAIEPRLVGPLCLSVPIPVLQYLLLPVVTEFRNLYPAVERTIDATDSRVDLDHAEADIAIRSSDTPPEHWVGRRLFPVHAVLLWSSGVSRVYPPRPSQLRKAFGFSVIRTSQKPNARK